MIAAPATIDEICDKLDPVVAVDILRAILSVVAESPEYAKDISPINYDFLFGGTPQVVETYEDLKQIDVLVENPNGRWCNITEAVSDLDCAEQLTPEWMFFLLCTNNSGGIGYYVPSHLALSCPNLLKVIKLHEDSHD